MSFDKSSVTFLDLYNLCMYSSCDSSNTLGFEISFFKPGTCWHAQFLIIAFVYQVNIHTYVTGPGKQVLSTQNMLVCIMTPISCSVCAI